MLETTLSLTKVRLGISTPVRDEYLTAIIESIIDELKNIYGLSLNVDSPHHLMFIVDYSAWRYLNRDSNDGMPRHLQFRLHNMIVSNLQ
ncbi:MAG: hypothetical protein GX957_03655 [Clostridiaceae bacterium]|nr:hypothetical protein [Clostridiaceae bacterium]